MIPKKTNNLKEQILNKLKEVKDPELGYDIVALGLIYEIEINEENKKINIKMGLTTPFCPLAGVILSNAYSAVASIDEIINMKYEINVDFDFEKMWSPEMMDPELKEQMGLNK